MTPTPPPQELRPRAGSDDDYLAAIRRDAEKLAGSLLAASDAGVGPALIVPQLVLVFRAAFGAMPADLLPMLAQVTGTPPAA
jgi:hypothetical protein